MKKIQLIILMSLVFNITSACGNDDPVSDPNSSKGTMFENGRPTDGLHLLNDDLSEDMWFSTGTLRTTTAVMQSFDLDFEKDLIYYTQLNSNYRIYLSWGERNGSAHKGMMQLHYFGHGANFSLETNGNDRYIWIDNYASKNSKGEYWDSQIISRVPVKADATLKPWDCKDNYYFGMVNHSVAVDIENDRLTVLGISSGEVRTYCLSELNKLPKDSITLKPITYGGDKAPDVETTKTFKVLARDCTKVQPLGQFTFKRDAGISWQGFDISGNYVYQARGNGNNNDGEKASTGWILIYRIDGEEILSATPINALNNMNLLFEWGITDTGYMEPEGVKIRRGVMYCGFASKNSNDIRRGTIFRYSPYQNELVR